MDTATKIYGTLFIGAIAAGLFYCSYSFWGDNPTVSILLGLFGLVMAFYSIGLFLIPLIEDLSKNTKKKKKH